jgi:putative flippase GtrA
MSPTQPPLLRRLLSWRVGGMFVRNTVVSCAVFAFDLALLWALVELLFMDEVLAAALAFLAAITVHYVFGRFWIFPGTERGVTAGYVYFLINAGIGLVVTLLLFAAFLHLVGMHYLVARIVASVFAGLAVFLLNAVLNFRAV